MYIKSKFVKNAQHFIIFMYTHYIHYHFLYELDESTIVFCNKQSNLTFYNIYNLITNTTK